MVDRTFAIGGEHEVDRLGFGAMRLCGPDIVGEPADPATARRVVERAVASGVDLIDTADAYGPGVSERLIAEAIDTRREDLLIATKAGLLRNRAGDWIRMGDPDYLRNAHLCSCDRLGVETIDLYQLHRPDPDVPFEDSVRALATLKDDGVVSHVGLSGVSVEQLDRAREVVEVATVQNEFNVADRSEAAVLEACENYGIGFMPYFPLGAGDLGDLPELDAVAAAHDATRMQVALAWLLHRSPVALPIPGTSNPDHLAENLAAREIELTDDEVARLTAAGA
jgi:aryl-alcohol dehydrogenase-like predicted oxidoreductase